MKKVTTPKLDGAADMPLIQNYIEIQKIPMV